MNKTKKVAWRKHRIKAKKYDEKRKAQKTSGATATSTARR
jgi:hypothetical protein